jgi:hypothetical protein
MLLLRRAVLFTLAYEKTAGCGEPMRLMARRAGQVRIMPKLHLRNFAPTAKLRFTF